MTASLATVARLWLYPVKSMQGLEVGVAHVATGGLRGDRGWAVVDADGEVVTARREPRLREVAPVLDGEDDLALLLPGAAEPVRGTAAADALGDLLGRAVAIREAEPGGGYTDVAAVHLVAAGALTAGHGAQPTQPTELTEPTDPGQPTQPGSAPGTGAATGDACSVEDPRANVWLDLVDPARSERDLVGEVVRLGGATLRLTRVPKHCLGVYAEVLEEGVVSLGDPVLVGGG